MSASFHVVAYFSGQPAAVIIHDTELESLNRLLANVLVSFALSCAADHHYLHSPSPLCPHPFPYLALHSFAFSLYKLLELCLIEATYLLICLTLHHEHGVQRDFYCSTNGRSASPPSTTPPSSSPPPPPTPAIHLCLCLCLCLSLSFPSPPPSSLIPDTRGIYMPR